MAGNKTEPIPLRARALGNAAYLEMLADDYASAGQHWRADQLRAAATQVRVACGAVAELRGTKTWQDEG